jgi:hypothetical protein
MLSIQWVAVPIAVLMVLIARRAARDEQALLARAWDSGKASGQAGPLDMRAQVAEARDEAGSPSVKN